MTKIKVKKQIDKLMDPNDGTATVRAFVKTKDGPVYYRSAKTHHFPNDIEVWGESEGCCDMWLNLPGNRVFTEEGDIQPKE